MVNTLARLGAFLADFLLMFGLSLWQQGVLDPYFGLISYIENHFDWHLELLKAPLYSRLICAYFLLTLWRALFGALGVVGPLQSSFGLKIEKEKKTFWRGFLRPVVNSTLRPLLIFHLPILYARRTFSEWLFKQKIILQGFAWPVQGIIVLGFTIVWVYLSPFIFFPKSSYPYLSEVKERQHNDSLDAGQSFTDFQIIKSNILGLTLLTNLSNGRFVILPYPQFVKNQLMELWRPRFLIYDRQNGSSGQLIVLQDPDYQKLISTAAREEQFFYLFYPELKNKQAYTAIILEDILYASMLKSPWQFSIDQFKSGFEHSGHLFLRDKILQHLELSAPQLVQKNFWKGIQVLAIEGKNPFSKDSQELGIISLDSPKYHSWKLSFEGEKSLTSNSLDSFFTSLFTGAEWNRESEGGATPNQLTAENFSFILMDYFFQNKWHEDGKYNENMEEYFYHKYFESARQSLEDGIVKEQKILIDSLESILSYMVKNNYNTSFVISTKGILKALKEKNQTFFK